MANLVINAPRQGISQSPHVGFAECVNLDIDGVPGIVRLNNIMVKKSASVVDATIKWFARDPVNTANIYAIDSNGSIYNSSDSGATWAELSDRDGAGQGLIVWKDYLFVAEQTTIDVYGPLSNSPSWTNNWQTIDSDTLYHPMIVSKNDSMIYGGAGRYIFSIEENSGQTFAPGTAATYTFTAQALDLPAAYRVKCLEELGNNLMIGTWQGSNVYDIRVADIFPWDRSSVSFGQPVVIDDYGIHAMKNTGNSLVVLAGISGTIYRCDGASAVIIGQLPVDLSGGKYMEWYPGGICSYKNKIFFGSGNGGSTAIAGQGVYSLQQTGQGNVLNLEHLNSALTDGSAASVKISALLPVSRDTLLVGWQSASTYGIDLTTNTSYAYGTDYSGYFVTPLYTIGSNLNKAKFTEIEFQLVRPLRTDEGIKIEYRTDLTASWTAIKTFAYSDTNVGGVVSKVLKTEVPYNIKECEQVQFKISLKGSSSTTPELKSITVRR